MTKGTLQNYELIFNKISKQGAVANIQYKEDSIVEGILYDVDDLTILDKYEGVKNNHYKRILVNINDVVAHTYICDNPQFIQENLKPTQEYLNYLLEGKDYLSVEYYEKLLSNGSKTRN